jgi:SAM-dependent methyltransferase
VTELRRRFHPESQFGGFTDMDGAVMFYARVQQLLAADATALDIGCGRGIQDDDPVRLRRELRILRGHCRQVIGIDIDATGTENRFIDEFRVIRPGAPWPIEPASIDLALADFVVEHVEDPHAFFGEISRVVKPGGYVCIRTINAHSYLGLASRIIPNRLHATTLRRTHGRRQEQDVFATHYRCNTRRQLAEALDRSGFDAVVYTSEDEPAYLQFSPAAYRLGLLHRRLAPRRMLVGLLGWGRQRTEPDDQRA